MLLKVEFSNSEVWDRAARVRLGVLLVLRATICPSCPTAIGPVIETGAVADGEGAGAAV